MQQVEIYKMTMEEYRNHPGNFMRKFSDAGSRKKYKVHLFDPTS